MKKNAIEVFGEWADLDKDFGMEKNHKDSVNNMINYSTEQDWMLFMSFYQRWLSIKINSIV